MLLSEIDECLEFDRESIGLRRAYRDGNDVLIRWSEFWSGYFAQQTVTREPISLSINPSQENDACVKGSGSIDGFHPGHDQAHAGQALVLPALGLGADSDLKN